jgi:hypothetical protein
MTPETHSLLGSVYMFALGIGIGMILQVLMIAVQNAVDYSDLGVATSSSILFRFIGGSLGTAILGTVFAISLANQIGHLDPAEAQAIRAALAPDVVHSLPDRLQAIRQTAISTSLNASFMTASLVGLFGFAIAWFLPELPLRKTIAAASEGDVGGNLGNALSMPNDVDSATELRRGLSVLAQRDTKPRSVQAVLDKAGVKLSPASACQLLRAGEDFRLDISSRDRCAKLTTSALGELQRQSLIEERTQEDHTSAWFLTEHGISIFQRLAKTRLSRLQNVCAEWESKNCRESKPEFDRILQGLSS